MCRSGVNFFFGVESADINLDRGGRPLVPIVLSQAFAKRLLDCASEIQQHILSVNWMVTVVLIESVIGFGMKLERLLKRKRPLPVDIYIFHFLSFVTFIWMA